MEVMYSDEMDRSQFQASALGIPCISVTQVYRGECVYPILLSNLPPYVLGAPPPQPPLQNLTLARWSEAPPSQYQLLP